MWMQHQINILIKNICTSNCTENIGRLIIDNTKSILNAKQISHFQSMKITFQSRGNSENVLNFKVNIDKHKKKIYLQQSLKYNVSISPFEFDSMYYIVPPKLTAQNVHNLCKPSRFISDLRLLCHVVVWPSQPQTRTAADVNHLPHFQTNIDNFLEIVTLNFYTISPILCIFVYNSIICICTQ